MKILQINSAENFGGGERHLLDLTHGLDRSGHEVFLALRKSCNWRHKVENFPDEKVFSLPLRNAFDFSSARRLAKIIRRQNIEIVHAHVARDYPLAALAVLLAGNTARIVLTRHVLFPVKSLHKIILAKVAAVIAVSKAVETQLKTQNIFAGDKIKFVSNALRHNQPESNKNEIRAEFRREHNVAPDDFLVTTIGELKFLKGQEDFLRAAAEVAERFPNAKFAVVGSDNSKRAQYRNHLTSLAAQSDLNGKIIWLDACDDVHKILAATDVFVSASHSESFGLAILEAMIAGCAIVATETAGAFELLQNNATGKLVALQNPQKMSRAITEFLASASLREKFGAAVRKSAKAKFSFDEMINSTEQIYFECLAQKRAASLSIYGAGVMLPEDYRVSS